MKLSLLLSLGVLISVSSFAQLGSTPQVGQNPYSNSSVARSAGDPVTPQDGSNTLGPVYQMSSCGLNYTTASQKTGQRISPPGVPQPATFAIAGIPATANILKAFVWCEGSGNGVAITINVTNPFTVSASFPMALIGSDADKCWGYQGTHSYRADVTSLVVGNGNYTISGFPTSTSSAGTNDMDGATMMVIWSDPTATWQGDIVIWDGCYVGIGTQQNITLNGFSACTGSVFNARTFIGIGDLQGLATPLTLNSNAPYLIPVEDWWNWVDNATTVTPGQNTSFFDVNAAGDCYNLTVAGLYWQSNCQSCCANPFTLNMTSTPSQCSGNTGTATATPVGGSGTFVYQWNSTPAQNTQTATNLPPGQYIVTVTDSLGCTTTDTVMVTGTGNLSMTTQQVNVLCNGGNNGFAIVNPTSGTSPYTYVWSPNVSATNSAAGLTAGSYAVTVTDLYGCQNSFTFNITEPALIPITATGHGATTLCLGFGAQLDVTVAGGSPPFTFNWLNNGSTNDSIFVSPTTTTTYSVVVSDACSAPPDTAFITVTVNQPPVVSFTGDNLSDCSPLCVNFTPQSTPAVLSAEWEFGDGDTSHVTNASHCYYLPGQYSVTVHVTDINGCIDSVEYVNYLTVHPDPVAQLSVITPQPTSQQEATIAFDDLSTGGDTCYWLFGDGDSLAVVGCGDVSHNYADTGAFTVRLVVMNQWGCSDTTYGDVYIVPSTSIYVPNTFTPNNDGKNDVFLVYGEYIADFHMYIFDRWGNLIFESTDMTKGWDGRANNGQYVAQIDTYVWVVTYSEKYDHIKHKMNGHVNLVK